MSCATAWEAGPSWEAHRIHADLGRHHTWVLANNARGPCPYILLNLLLSMLAGLQGAILLIPAKRQDAIAAAMAQHDYDTNVKAKEEIELLMSISNQQLAILRELKRMATAEVPDMDRYPGT